MKVNIKQKTNDAIKQKINKFIKDSQQELKVGFLENSKYPNSDATTVQVAINNEYGHITKEGNIVPPRPFMKQTVDKNEKKWMEVFKTKIVEYDLDIEKTLNVLGIIASSDVKETIVNGNFAPLSQYTIDKKGTNKPLIETTHMLNSVDYEITKKE